MAKKKKKEEKKEEIKETKKEEMKIEKSVPPVTSQFIVMIPTRKS